MDPMTLVRWELALASRPDGEKATHASTDSAQDSAPVQDEEVQGLSPVAPPSRSEEAMLRNESFENPAPSPLNGAAKPEEPAASNGRSVSKGKIKRAAVMRKVPLSVAETNSAEIRIEPVAATETSDEGLGTYKARVTTTVREDRGFAAPPLETIPAGTEVNILEAKGEWFRVRTNGGTGKVGYIRKEFVVPAEP
jgi:hypothetical protein